MLDDTQSSMSIYPSNKTLSIGDKNVSGINIATQGANFSTNTIKIGNVNSTVNVGGNVTMKYGDCSITAKSLQGVYNVTSYTEGSEYSYSIWGLGGDNNYGSMKLSIPIQLSAYTTYRMTITCKTNQPSMFFYLQNPDWNPIYTSPTLTNTFQTFVFTFTNGSSESTPLFYITTNDTVIAGKSFIWNYVKLETVCVGIGTTNPGYMLDVAGTSRLGAWEFNTIHEKFNYCLGTQLPVTHTNYALYQTSAETLLNNGNKVAFRVNNEELMTIKTTGIGIGTYTPAYKLDVSGNTRIAGDLYVGTDQPNAINATELGTKVSAAIHFAGTYGDTDGFLYSGGYISSRRYSTTAGSEKSELLIFKGDGADSTYGPDRIRLKAGNLLFDTYSSFDNNPETSGESTRMLIDKNGNVGIGTTTPAYLFDVNGTARISSTSESQIGNWKFAGNTIGTNTGSTDFALYQSAWATVLNAQGTTGTIYFKKSNVTQWEISAEGNLNKSGDSGNVDGINLPTGSGINWRSGFSRIVDNNDLRICTDDNIRFNTGCSASSLGTEKMTIIANGNVGIGTTSPAYLFDVAGKSRMGAWLLNTNDATSPWAMGTQSPLTHNNMALYQDSTETILNGISTIRMRIGNAGINGNDIMKITSNGVGIGLGNTTSPAYLFDVAGSGRFTGDLHVGTAHTSATETGAYATGTIYFAPPYGDAGSSIACRRFSTLAGSEQTELLLLQGNDRTDRIRLRSPEIRFDTYDDANTYDGTYVTTKMLIDYNGNVGIGTESPAYKLDVNGTARISSTSESQIGNWKFSNNYIGTNPGGTDFVLYQSGGDTVLNTQGATGIITFKKNNLPTMHIDGAGNVGIGTTTPETYKLSVNGEVKIGSWYTNSSYLGTASPSGSNNFALYQIPTLTVLNSPTELRLNIGDAQKMTIISNGNVGIGTASPAYLLDVNGTSRLGAWGFNTTSQEFSYALGTQVPVTHTNYAMYQTSSNTLINTTGYMGFHVNNSEKMRMIASGYIGIGTTSPSYPLHIGIRTGNVSIGGMVHAPYQNFLFGATMDHNVSIYTYGSIISELSFVAISDRRIKTNIVDVVDDSALILFRKLQPKTYTYKDIYQKGDRMVHGFIAQEVKELLPNAVGNVTRYIPNIYSEFTVTGDTFTVDSSQLEYDASGGLFPKLKMIKNDGSEQFVNIISVNGNTIQIDTILTDEKVFLYGQEVDNFHTLEKDAIWTVATAALQEVDRQLQQEKTKTQTLQEEVQTLQQNYVALQQNYVSLQQSHVSLQQNYVSLFARILALESKGSAP
jgi:hypothetical protein